MAKRLRISDKKPDHYWVLISKIGILILNTIGTFDTHRRTEVYHLPDPYHKKPRKFPLYEFFYFRREAYDETWLQCQLEHRNIIPEHGSGIAKLYDIYMASAKSGYRITINKNSDSSEF